MARTNRKEASGGEEGVGDVHFRRRLMSMARRDAEGGRDRFQSWDDEGGISKALLPSRTASLRTQVRAQVTAPKRILQKSRTLDMKQKKIVTAFESDEDSGDDQFFDGR